MATMGGNLKCTSTNGVKVYSITGQARDLPMWTSEKKLRALRKDRDYTQRVELLQDLRFETATTRIKATPDGEYLIASGIYPPQVKVYELRELALKFERHLISEIINFEVLGDDYSKIAFLCADRSVCLHAKYGSHYSLRIPRMGRDISYDSWSCDLLCAASSPDLYRINLEQGRFLSSLVTESPGLNVVTRSKVHGLVACGGDDGAVECFDMRVRSSVGRLDAVAHAEDRDQEVTAVEFDGEGGYCMGVGSSSGKVLIYDLRSSNPMRVKDHMYGSPIINIKWQRTLNSEKPKLITTDSKVVRIWDPETGEGMTSIEPKDGGINDICVFNESGLMLLALNSSEIPSYFIPALGPAPKWCSYLDNMTEEMEGDAGTTIYENYKFLTKEELERLGLKNLIGTNCLRAYMHGFFIHIGLYKKAKELAHPFAYDDYLERRKKEKMEGDRGTRITDKKKLPKVNRVLAGRLQQAEEEDNAKDEDGIEVKKKSKKKRGFPTDLLTDDRFAKIFKNQDFEIDEFSEQYLALHPLAPTKQPSLLVEHFDRVNRDNNISDSDASAASLSSDDDELDHKNKKKHQARRMFEVKDDRHADAFFNCVSLAKEDSLSMGERVAAMTRGERGRGRGSSHFSNDIKVGPGGSREISFVSRSKSKYKEDDDDEDMGGDQRGKRRGVQSLGLKPDRSSGFGGRGRGRGRGHGGGRNRGGHGRGRGGW